MSVISIMEQDSVPRMAQCQAPHVAQWNRYRFGMIKKPKSIQEVLADNVMKYIVQDGEKKLSLRDISDAPNIDVGANTVKRMADGTGDPKLGSVAEVAKFFGVEPWQLLHPDFQPGKWPARVLTKSEAEFYERLLRDIRGLNGGEEAPVTDR